MTLNGNFRDSSDPGPTNQVGVWDNETWTELHWGFIVVRITNSSFYLVKAVKVVAVVLNSDLIPLDSQLLSSSLAASPRLSHSGQIPGQRVETNTWKPPVVVNGPVRTLNWELSVAELLMDASAFMSLRYSRRICETFRQHDRDFEVYSVSQSVSQSQRAESFVICCLSRCITMN